MPKSCVPHIRPYYAARTYTGLGFLGELSSRHVSYHQEVLCFFGGREGGEALWHGFEHLVPGEDISVLRKELGVDVIISSDEGESFRTDILNDDQFGTIGIIL